MPVKDKHQTGKLEELIHSQAKAAKETKEQAKRFKTFLEETDNWLKRRREIYRLTPGNPQSGDFPDVLSGRKLTNKAIQFGGNPLSKILKYTGDFCELIIQFDKMVSQHLSTRGEFYAETLFRMVEFAAFREGGDYLKKQILKYGLVSSARGGIYVFGATASAVVFVEITKGYGKSYYTTAESHVKPFLSKLFDSPVGDVLNAAALARFGLPGLIGASVYLAHSAKSRYDSYAHQKRIDAIFASVRHNPDAHPSASHIDKHRGSTLSFLQAKFSSRNKNNLSPDGSPQFFITASPITTASISAPNFNDDDYHDAAVTSRNNNDKKTSQKFSERRLENLNATERAIVASLLIPSASPAATTQNDYIETTDSNNNIGVPAASAGSQLPSILLGAPVNSGFTFPVVTPKEILIDAARQAVETNIRSSTLAPPVQHDIFLAEVTGQTLKHHQEKAAAVQAANQGKVTHSGGIYVTPDGKPGIAYSGSFKTESNHHMTLGAGIDASGRRSVSIGTDDPKIGGVLFVGYLLIETIRWLRDSEKNYHTIPGITHDSEKTRGLTKILSKFSGKPATLENVEALKAAITEYRSHLLYSDFIQSTGRSEPVLRDDTIENKTVKTLSGQDVFDGLLHGFTEGAKKIGTIPNINEITSEKLVKMATDRYAYLEQKAADAHTVRQKQYAKHNDLVSKSYNARNILGTLNAIISAQKELHDPTFLKSFAESLSTAEGCDSHAHQALIEKNLVAAQTLHARAQTLRGAQYSDSHAKTDREYALRLAETGHPNEAKNTIDAAVAKGISEHIDAAELKELYVSALRIEMSKPAECQNKEVLTANTKALLDIVENSNSLNEVQVGYIIDACFNVVQSGANSVISDSMQKMLSMPISPEQKMKIYCARALMECSKPVTEQNRPELISILQKSSDELKKISSENKEFLEDCTKRLTDLKSFVSSHLWEAVNIKLTEGTCVARNEAFRILQEVHSSLSNEKPLHEFRLNAQTPSELKRGRVDFIQDDTGRLKYSTILPNGKEIHDQSLDIETNGQLTPEKLQQQKEKILDLLSKKGHISQLTHKDISAITMAQWHCERLEFSNAADVIKNQLTAATECGAPEETITKLHQQYENTVSQQVKSYQLGLSAASKAVQLMLDTVSYEVVPVSEIPSVMKKNKVYARQHAGRVEYITSDMKKPEIVELCELENKNILDIASERGHIFNVDHLRRMRNGFTFISSSASAYFSDILKKMKLNPSRCKNLWDYLSPKAFLSHLTDKCKSLPSGGFKEGFGTVNGALFFVNMCANMLSQEISKGWSEKDKKNLEAKVGGLDAVTNTTALAYSLTDWHELYSQGLDKLMENGALSASTTLAGATYGTLLPATSVANWFCEFDKNRAAGNAPTGLLGITLEESYRLTRNPYVSQTMFAINNAPTVYAWGNAALLSLAEYPKIVAAAKAIAAAGSGMITTASGFISATGTTLATACPAAANLVTAAGSGIANAGAAIGNVGGAAITFVQTHATVFMVVGGVAVAVAIIAGGIWYYNRCWYENHLHNIKTKLDLKSGGHQNRLDAQKSVDEILKYNSTHEEALKYKKQIEVENANVAATSTETQKAFENTKDHWTRVLQGIGDEGAFTRFLSTFSSKENVAGMQERFSSATLAKIKADILSGRMYAPRVASTEKSINDYSDEVRFCLRIETIIPKEIERARDERKKNQEYIAEIVKKADLPPETITSLQMQSKAIEDSLDKLEKMLTASNDELKICFSNCSQLLASPEFISLSELVAQRHVESIHAIKVDTAIEIAGTASVLLTHAIADYFKGERERAFRFPDWSFSTVTPSSISKSSSLFQTAPIKKNILAQPKEATSSTRLFQQPPSKKNILAEPKKTVSIARNSVLFPQPKKEEKSAPIRGMRYAIH